MTAETPETPKRRRALGRRRHAGVRVPTGRPQLRTPVELDLIGAERAALLTYEQRRGLRLAHWFWTTPDEGPRDFALGFTPTAHAARRSAGADAAGHGHRRPGVRTTRGDGLGHGGLIRWVDEAPAGAGGTEGASGVNAVTRWPALGDQVTDLIERTRIKGPFCPGTQLQTAVPGEQARRLRCHRLAGEGTDHLGVGFCKVHGGRWPRGAAMGAWLMGHAFGRELDLNPWDALLKAVRIAAGKSAYCEYVLSLAHDDLELEGRAIRRGRGAADDILVHPDTGEPLGVGAYRDLSFWVTRSEFWADRMARYAKMAIDAGVAERLVERAQLDASRIVEVLNGTLEALGDELSEDVQFRLRAQLRAQLLALDARDTNVVNGEVVDVLPAGAGT